MGAGRRPRVADAGRDAGIFSYPLYQRQLPVTGMRTLDEQIGGRLGRERLVGLLLASVGLYGVLAFAVSRRSREVGIRMALGARPADVLRMVLREAAALVLVRTGIGLAAAAAVTRFIASRNYGVKPFDPATVLTASLVLLGTAALAAWLPARGAARLDPMATLRTE